MVVYKLENFPNVCKLCLRSDESQAKWVALDEYRESFGETVEAMCMAFANYTEKAKRVRNVLPQKVCPTCVQVLELFVQFRRKMHCVLQFSSGVLQLQRGNLDPIVGLYNEDSEYLALVLQDLGICNFEDASLNNLLNQFPKFHVSALDTSELVDPTDPTPYGLFKIEIKSEPEDSAPEMENYGAEGCDGQDEALSGRGRPLKRSHKVNEEMARAELKKAKQAIRKAKQVGKKTGKAPVKLAVPHLRTKRKQQQQTSDSDGDRDDDDEDYDDGKDGEGKNSKDGSWDEKYRVHLQKRTTTELFPCKYDICSKTFDSKQSVREHVKLEHTSFSCEHCGNSMKTYAQFKMHILRHAATGSHECEYCGVKCYTKQDLNYHCESVHISNPMKEQQCDECGMIFKTKTFLQRHMLSHADYRKFVCELCETAFKTSHHLNRHRRTIHDAIRYACNHCDMDYGRRDKLRAHMELVHNVQSYFVCHICLVSFETSSRLEEHKQRHRNPKELECGTCLTVYLNQNDFDKHICITYQDSYRCCGRDFRYHYHYNKHMLVGHGIKTNVRVRLTEGKLLSQQRAARKHRIPCEQCGIEFPSKMDYRRHSKKCGIDDRQSEGYTSLQIEVLWPDGATEQSHGDKEEAN